MIRIKNPTPASIRLPNAYQEVEYLEGTGTQYIDTGINPGKETTKIVCESTYSPDGEGHYSGMSFKAWSTTNSFAFGCTAANGLALQYSTSTHTSDYVFPELPKWYRFILAHGEQKCIDISSNATIISATTTLSITSDSAKFLLFAKYAHATSSVTYSNRICRIRSCQEYNSGTLVKDFVPCYRKSDNEPGMYDLVNNVFYANAGSGTFLIGNEVGKRDLNINPNIVDTPLLRRYVKDKLVYGEAPQSYEQLVNYTMLYDGSLGDTELNECKDITGGYIHNSGLSRFWVQSDLTRNTNSLSTSLTNSTTSKGKTGSLVTFSEIDLTQYVKVANRYSFTHTNSSSSYNLLYTIRLIGRDVSHNTLGNPVIFTVKNTKDPYMNVDDGDYFITRNVSAFGLSPNKAHLSITVMVEYRGTISANIYALALFKQDNWQELCTIAGLNSSDYTDEAALCANSTAIATILSNKEAVQYMIYNCTGSFMAEFVASSTCLTALNNSAYNTTIQANEHWNKFLSMVA